MQVMGRNAELPVDILEDVQVATEVAQQAEQEGAADRADALEHGSIADPKASQKTPSETLHNSQLRDQFWELEELKITQAKQKEDCLYLHCQSNQPCKILQAIAPNSQALSSSVMFAEGVRRVKLHGKGWALGVDLPIDHAALLAAEIIECLRQDPNTKKTALKVLLHQSCLNILCECQTAIPQAIMALPILNALRQTRPSDYLQSVTVSSRVIGQKLPSWSFEIDLLAIGIVPPSDRPDLLSANSEEDSESEDTTEEEKESSIVITYSLSILKYLLSGKWLFTHQPKSLTLITCLSSLVVGSMGTFILDRTFFNYAQPQAQLKNQVQSSSVELKDNRLTDRPKLNFQIDLLNDKLALIDWHISAQRRPPDVLIMGSSRALRGVEPTILEQSLAQNGYKGISVFNFGVNGATAKVVNLQLTEILSSQQLPRMIIWADGVRAFNSNRTDITYDEISTSPGYKQLQASRKSKDASTDGKSEQNPNKDLDSEKPVTPLGKMFHAVFDSYPQRQQVRASLVKGFDQSTLWFSNRRQLLRAAQPNRSAEMDSKGFVAFDVTFDPKTYFQNHPQVSGDYDLDYRDFNLNGKQMESFTAVSEFCRQHNIQLVFVNLPLHNVYLDPTRSRYELLFSSRMRDLATQLNFTYIDLSQTWRNQAALFSDPSHLNRQGAIAVAKELASNSQIRWKSASY
ncbi:D-alanyl-lipoteichoic acid biosynthesis protein DltD [Tumidithrix elongata RA019]|uniref:D-alanyl-lipoteichoic acid biosynthesis protein DltD n=1 Tax=Tumidithrix elongata BACA0141 TaxID=2716417 RepID=A0AAW9Q7P6_9CYAN|nr:D-alanyl-lipoteichoic acid biosynthesis protein DltD [Tumidithrix elongata RA019]